MSTGAGSGETWTVRKIMDWSGAYLKERGFDSARLDVELLLADVLDCERLRLYLDMERPLSPEERGQFRDALKRRGDGEPVAYIRGERDFMGDVFAVSPDVLIPRPDTEVLVEQALALAEQPSRVLDIGTGSGCIAVSLSKRWPDTHVEGWDVSEDALAVARTNNERMTTSVQMRQADALTELANEPGEKFDLIVSNPPYIERGDADMCAMVKKHEPEVALFCEDDGLTFYRRFAERAKAWLAPGGWLMVEVGHKQSADVEALFRDGGLVDVETVLDYAKLPRVVKGRFVG